jgi:hypothetical protein
VDNPIARALAPYFLAAAGLLMLATLRSWRFYDRKLDALVTLLIIFALAAVAGAVDLGTDVPDYRYFYNSLVTLQQHYGWWEPGFEWLATVFAKSGAPYGLFAFAMVVTSHLIKFHVFDRCTSNRLLAFFVLFCFDLGEVAFVRQYLAASILLLAFYLLTRHRIGWAMLLVLCATLIHKTALLVGTLLLFVYYGRAALKPLGIMTLVILVLAVALPTAITDSIENRIFEQLAVYTVEGYVQGLQSEDISLPRNLAKFGVYAALALWMLTVPARSETDLAQRRAGQVVLAISLVGFSLVAIVSPVFSRLSVYAFPFLAVCARTERFAPRYSQALPQFAIVLLLLANLLVASYPLAEFL